MCRNRVFKYILFISFMLLAGLNLHAQDLLKNKDLSQLRVDMLTDDDLIKLKTQMNSVGMTIDQAEQVALSRGMSPAEFNKLKQKLAALDARTNTGTGKLNPPANIQKPVGRPNNGLDTLDVYSGKEKTLPLINPLIFGSELYTGVAPSFEPNSSLATPVNYILGPNDQVLVSVYGVQQYEGDLVVSPEGNISIPSVGLVKVAGLTIEAATQKLKTVMGNSVYPYLKSGGSRLSVTLSKIRSIKVTVIGSNRPGNFTVSSLATVFNVLYIAGGPSTFGSFREIELLRDNKVIRKIDLYRLLLAGDQSDNIGLRDNDVIRIPAYKNRVELQDQVKRPGIFEVLPGETFANVLAFASGFTDTAYQASVKVFQRSDKERKIFDLPSSSYNSYQPSSGDLFVVSKILNRFENRVTISGAVFRPDVYQLTPGMHVADLIRRADGLKEDAFKTRGQIIRLQDNLTKSIVSFDIQNALAGNQADNLLLQREDEVMISSILELRDTFKVTIQGEIRMPGAYNYVENLTLKDLILQAGGTTDAAYNNVEIARVIKRDSVDLLDSRATNIIRIPVNIELGSSSANLPLQPYDVVTIRRKAGYLLPETVTVSGQVQYPGPYALSSRNERVSDLLKRAGGYSPDAFPEAAYLKRLKTEQEKKKAEKAEDVVKKIRANNADTSTINIISAENARSYDQIPLNMEAIKQAPGSIEDITLRANDELVIPKFDAQVRVSGAVLLATQIPYQSHNSLKDYINEAGGYGGNAWRKKTYVVYANGRAAATRHFLFFKMYPKILPGSELVVPQKPEKKGMNTGEIIGIASALASLAGVVIALLRL